uniref:Fibronectin type-III domain-containing protein n=1 Tax=Salarias fasciatus TaxID=181472 RepID=A0A672IEM7_SALFA
SRRRVNRTTMVFYLPKVETANSSVICKMREDHQSLIVNGLDLRGGLPPEKPGNIICETTKSSEIVDCSWRRGWETHFTTYYNISVRRENGTKIHSHQIKVAEKTTLPRGMLDTNTKYLLIITAFNYFGLSESDPYSLCIGDIVIPETPQITQVVFMNNSAGATLCWKTSESSSNLRVYVRLRTEDIAWVKKNSDIFEGRIEVDDLKPLTEYEFQMRTCKSAAEPTHGDLNTSMKTACSKWSSSVRQMSPGKGPSRQLDVWRTLSSLRTHGMQMVTVFWKPPSPEDYSGEVQQYKIFWVTDQKHEVTCAAADVQWTGRVSSEVQTLAVAAVTSYGTSPPAQVTLTHSDALGPVLEELTPALSGKALLVSWSWPVDHHRSALAAELLYYVIEWRSVPAADLQWQKLSKDLHSTSVTGLTAGVRYDISLHAVTSRGVSAPSSRTAYSSEKTPFSGPNMSVLAHENRRILIEWDELPVDQQRGHITKYTIYFQGLDSTNTVLNVTVPVSGPRQTWLDCPSGALVLQMTASTSMGEGPPGKPVSSLPTTYAVLIAITANLMCWSCIRERVKQKCISWGPDWFVDNMPNLECSNAIKLLEHDGSEPVFSSIHSETPLSSITVVSQEARDEVYPAIHIEVTQTYGSERPIAETSLLIMSDESGYKPQIATLAHQGEETNDKEDKQNDYPESREEDGCAFVLGGLRDGFSFGGDVDFSDSPRGLDRSSVTCLLWPTTAETIVLAEQSVGRESLSLDLTQDDIMTPDTTDISSSQQRSETTMLNGGYFPQIAAAGGIIR